MQAKCRVFVLYILIIKTFTPGFRYVAADTIGNDAMGYSSLNKYAAKLMLNPIIVNKKLPLTEPTEPEMEFIFDVTPAFDFSAEQELLLNEVDLGALSPLGMHYRLSRKNMEQSSSTIPTSSTTTTPQPEPQPNQSICCTQMGCGPCVAPIPFPVPQVMYAGPPLVVPMKTHYQKVHHDHPHIDELEQILGKKKHRGKKISRKGKRKSKYDSVFERSSSESGFSESDDADYY